MKKLVIFVFLLLFGLVSAVPVYAAEHDEDRGEREEMEEGGDDERKRGRKPPKKAPDIRALMREADDETRDQLRELSKELKEKTEDLRKELREKRKNLNQSLLAFPIEAGSAKSLRNEVERINRELFAIRLAIMIKTQNIVGEKVWEATIKEGRKPKRRGPPKRRGRRPGRK